MAGAQAGRRAAYALATLGLILAVAPRASAIEAFDGRIQAHGFAEVQLRSLSADFAEEIDLSQWYNVFNLELEADILPDGWGPFDLLQAYVRVEARYDAVYNNGMWLFPSVETFGNSSKRLPLRLRDALDQDYAGTINSNAQANPPGDVVGRVPARGDLADAGITQSPDGRSYRERDPFGWSVESVTDRDTIDWERDADGVPMPDPKNPVDPDDINFIYQTLRSGQLLENLTAAERDVYNTPAGLPVDPTDPDCAGGPPFGPDCPTGIGDPVSLIQAITGTVVDNEIFITCGTERGSTPARPGAQVGGIIECRALPAAGSNGRALPTLPATPGGTAPNQSGSDGDAYSTLLDLGDKVVTDPLTGETATVAELYGDVQFVDTDGDTVPDSPLDPTGFGKTGLGSRLQGAGLVYNPASGDPEWTLPVEDPFDPDVQGVGVLIGYNATCPTNRTDSRDPYARQADGSLEFSDPVERQAMLGSGKVGSCPDNRPEQNEIVKRRAFPGFDTLFDQEGADGELGINPDYSDPALTDRTTPVSELRETVNAQLVADGFPSIEDGGLNGFGRLDKPAFDEEQELLNEFAPFFRGIAPERDDPAFYALEDLMDWRFTTREFKGPQGGTGGTLLMGPWLPKNFFETLATLEDRANSFRGRGTPTLVSRLDSSDFDPTDSLPFTQEARAAGDRYSDLDVEAMSQLLAENGFIPTDNAAANYIPDEANVKVIAFVPDPGGGPDIEAVVGLDFSAAKFLPDPVDDRISRVDDLLVLLDDAGIRLRRRRQNNAGGGVPGQVSVGAYPNDILSLPDAESRFSYRFLGTRYRFNIPLLQRDGPSLGGDYSGILPCLNPIRSVTRTQAQLPATMAARISGQEFADRCIPFTNITAVGGTGELPLRPASDMSNLMAGLPFDMSRGNYIPSQGLLRALETIDFDDPEFNLNENERSWNRGASQSDTFEVKEAYADMEFLDSRLWIRFGLQNIVWGKTELFRTTDQFNPQDLALASLPSLEESRIALLSGRAVYSLYDVGPLEDVRIELAANFDRIKPSDLGTCGEPYTIDIICALTAGFAFHGITGIGVAGTDRPPNAWDDVDGIEFGGRVEFRWDRFSFAIVDFYGYNDFPYPDLLMSYFRDVDTQTGRMRKAFADSPCENAGGFVDRVPVRTGDPYDPFNPNPGHPSNQLPAWQAWSAGNTRLAEEVDFDARRATLDSRGDPTALPTGSDTADPLDDWVKHPIAYTIQGIGVDPGCLKPGGLAGKPNENRFDVGLAPDQPLELVRADPDDPDSAVLGIDVDGDGVPDFDQFASTDFSNPTDFNNSTMGQWEREGFSVDDALEWHPANQQIFALLCLGTVSIAASLDPGACAWSIFGTGAALAEGVISLPFSEALTLLFAGEPGSPTPELQAIVLTQTKGLEGQFENIPPVVSMSRDARDGLTTGVDTRVTGNDPFNPGDLGDVLTMGNTLTAQQQALLGCGPFFGTRCDSGEFYNSEVEAGMGTDPRILPADKRRPPPARPSPRNRFLPTQPPPAVFDSQALEFANGNGGIDVLGAEGNVLLQSIPGYEGTAEVKGTYQVLQRVDPSAPDSPLLRLGDGNVDLTGIVDPSLLDPTDPTKYRVPDSYIVELDLLADLNGFNDVLSDNVGNPSNIGSPTCPGPLNVPPDPACPGLDQLEVALNELNEKFIADTITPAEEATRIELTRNQGQIDRQKSRLSQNSQATRDQEQAVGRATQRVLDSFRIGGDPVSGDNRSSFGLTRQLLDSDGNPVEMALDGAVVDGLEALGAVNSHVTWSNAPQPGTLGNAGLVNVKREFVPDPGGAPIQRDPETGQLVTDVVSVDAQVAPNPFFGGATCTRFDPESPYADENGIVKLPGCRGAISMAINQEAPPSLELPGLITIGANVYDIGPADRTQDNLYAGTVDIRFEDFYDPRVDGCITGPTLSSRDGKSYKVQAVNADGSADNFTQALLEKTCFNTALEGVEGTIDGAGAFTQKVIESPDAAGMGGDLDEFGNPILILNPDGTTEYSASTTRRTDDPLLQYTVGIEAVPQAFANTLFHPWASCLQSSALFGSANTGLSYALPNDVSPVARSRPWAVDGAAPATERLPLTRTVAFVPDADGNFQVDAGVAGSVPDGESVSDAGGSRASFICDVRTRDYENDIFEGVLKDDLDGDGLIAQGAQVFNNELAAWSWNFMMFLVTASCNAVSGGDDLGDADCFRPSTPWALDRCSFSQPQFCRNVKGFLGVAGLRRNDYRAGGNGTFGRRDFIWHSGGEVALKYKRRNVFGVSADFAEDVTKTNWGVEFTWVGPVPFFDNDSFDSTTSSHALNLTVSVDRPTFINFLNANRTFFMNSQWFIQYLPDHSPSFASAGPFNALFTFAVFTGYYQDRFLPQVVTVYDFRSQSGGFLPQISYRFTEAFSITIGVSFFIGRGERITMPLNGIGPTVNRAGKNAYTDGTERFISLIRGRDEAFMRIRWTF